MRSVAPYFFLLLVVGATAGLERSAGAQEIHPTADRSAGKTATDAARRGRRARDAGRWVEAQAAYKAALEAVDPASSTEAERAELAGELGLCELALRKYRDAAEHLAASLERRTALRLPLQLRFEVGQRKAAPHVATLYLSVDPPDAEVVVDGKAVERPSRTYRLFLEPGQHMVRALSTGHEEAFQSFDVAAGKAHTISMQLPRAAAPAVRAKKEETAPPKAATAPPAGRVRAPGPWASWPGTLRIGGVALATAAVSVGAVFMIRARVLDGDLGERRDVLLREGDGSPGTCNVAAPPAGCSELDRLKTERDRFAGLGTATVVAGGVLGAVTAASFLTELSFPWRKSATERHHVLLAATPQQVRLLVHGAW